MSVPTVASVGYLNALPLVDGLDTDDGVRVVADVPSRLLGALLARRAAVALCPVIDYQTSPEPLEIVPAGAIGSSGITLTVRLFSRRPLSEIRDISVDGDSRTSVALLQIVLDHLFGIRPSLSVLGQGSRDDLRSGSAEALLLIGDKVVTAAPDALRFPHQLDLGEAWHGMTGLPFVFATWMTLEGTDLALLPRMLDRRRALNLARLDEIVDAHAADHGWKRDLARFYLGSVLRYDLGQRELKAITLFWEKCLDLGLIDRVRGLALYRDGQRVLRASAHG